MFGGATTAASSPRARGIRLLRRAAGLLALAPLLVRADLVVHQRVEYPAGQYWMTEDRIVRFKGGKARQDTTFSARGMTNNGVIASVPWGTNTAVITTIKDLTNGDSVTLTEVHGDKTAVKTSGEVQKLKATGTMVRLAGRPKPPPPADSGVAAKLGDYQTEVFDWTDAGGVRMKLWVAKAFPNYGAIVASLEKLYGLPAPDPTQGWIPPGPECGPRPGGEIRDDRLRHQRDHHHPHLGQGRDGGRLRDRGPKGLSPGGAAAPCRPSGGRGPGPAVRVNGGIAVS